MKVAVPLTVTLFFFGLGPAEVGLISYPMFFALLAAVFVLTYTVGWYARR